MFSCYRHAVKILRGVCATFPFKTLSYSYLNHEYEDYVGNIIDSCFDSLKITEPYVILNAVSPEFNNIFV